LLCAHAPERLILIEPSRSLAAGLRDRFEGLAEVSVVNAALSDRLGTATLFGPDPESSLASLVRRESVHRHIDFQRDCEHVAVIDFPELLRRTGVQSVDLLKLDVEGHEYEILRGMPSELRGALRCIQFEFGGACIDSRVFFRDYWKLLDPDFEILRLARTGVIPIRRYREREERFEQVNFLCVNRRLRSAAS
jgi:FkbM family methyltransferase